MLDFSLWFFIVVISRHISVISFFSLAFHMKLTFQQRLARQTSLLIAGAIIIMTLLINSVFFVTRYSFAQKWLTPQIRQTQWRFWSWWPIMKPFDEALWNEMQQETIIRNIISLENQYFVYKRTPRQIIFFPVTRFVNAQYFLFLISWLCLFFFVLWWYILSHYFTRKSMRHLRILSHALSDINIETLETKLPLPPGPDTDDIRHIAMTLQDMLHLLATQKKSLTDFVSFASHELKTPLMEISSTLDAIPQTEHKKEHIQTIQTTIRSMDTLIWSLLLLTQWQQKQVKLVSCDLVEIINKHITSDYTRIIPLSYNINTHQAACDIIFHNLVNNALLHGTWEYTLTRENNTLLFSNTWSLPTYDIWQPFSRSSLSQWHGLGLALVRTLCEKIWWDITAYQEKNTVFFVLTLPWISS